MNHKKYFLSHVVATEQPNFYEVVTPLKVFKKLPNNLIGNLTIPVGAEIYASDYTLEFFKGKCGKGTKYEVTNYNVGKLRASKAVVNSIYDRGNDSYVQKVHSDWDESFVYRVGKMMKPKLKFSHINHECNSGIHFFLTIGQALGYVL